MRLSLLTLLCLGLAACPTPEKGSCKTDDDCTSDEACCDGRCRNVQTDSTNCGACNAVCNLPNTLPSCSAGRCQVTCTPGYGNCNGARDDGCEYVTANDVSNCGVCNRVCMSINAAPVCVDSRCATGTCTEHFENCDDDDINGCEIDTRIALEHCGACGNKCVLANATARCQSSTCAVASCQTNWGNCDGLAPNGCEVDFTSDAQHCGACDKVCGPGQSCVASLCRANELIVFGGKVSFADTSVTRQVSRFDLATGRFTVLTPATPDGNIPGRWRHVAAWDLPRNRMIVWGGGDGSGTPAANDTWALDFEVVPPVWRKLTTQGTAPSPRFGPASALDARSSKLYVFGGMTAQETPLSDLHVLDLVTLRWSEVHGNNSDGGPSDRFSTSGAFDPVSRTFLVYGGHHGVITTDLGELWKYDVVAQSWTPSPIPPFPSGWAQPRALGAFFSGHPAYLYSGIVSQRFPPGSASMAHDFWELDPSQSDPWRFVMLPALPTMYPRPRLEAAAVERDGLLYLFAGGEVDADGSRTLHDFWMYAPDGGAWSLLNDGGVGAMPTARLSGSMIAR